MANTPDRSRFNPARWAGNYVANVDVLPNVGQWMKFQSWQVMNYAIGIGGSILFSHLNYQFEQIAWLPPLIGLLLEGGRLAEKSGYLYEKRNPRTESQHASTIHNYHRSGWWSLFLDRD